MIVITTDGFRGDVRSVYGDRVRKHDAPLESRGNAGFAVRTGAYGKFLSYSRHNAGRCRRAALVWAAYLPHWKDI